MQSFDPLVTDFILFCVDRRGNQWPALYDEMCRVAAQHLYRGMGYGELRSRGFSLSLSNMDETLNMVDAAVASHGVSEG